MTLAELDEPRLLECCGSRHWVAQMMAAGPFRDMPSLETAATDIWWRLAPTDWLEAFSRHPQIGEKGKVSAWSSEEQSGMNSAATDTAEKLATLNRIYFDKFGWIFIVCATGKSAEEMLRLLEARLANQPEDELRLAAAEQNQITLLRLRKLFHATRISTHVLNTSSGKPAGGVPVHLYQADRQIAAGATDADGRCQNLLASGQTLIPGVYRLVFDVAALFPDGLYPEVNISFSVNAEVAHYHLPLLISPFGYTTYRGS